MTATPDAALLEVDGVSKIFHARRGGRGRRVEVAAVNDVDLRIDPGETVGIVGETGSGKSTLGRMILGLDAPTKGSVKFDGQPIAAMSRKQVKQLRRRMQVVFQDPYESLNPYMTVREILEEPFRVHDIYDRDRTPARIAELLDVVGLPRSALRRTPLAFSGGQQQRLVIARSLTLDPDLLVADEPTASLDVSIQAQILNLMLDIQRQRHMSMLLISHNLRVIRHMSARMGVMYAGRIVETGFSGDVYRAPKHPYTTALLSAVPVANPRKERERHRIKVTGEAADPASLPSGCPFHPRCWLAEEQCRTTRPMLRPVGAAGQLVACHVAK
jgi:peptide/nickel transport system ATP-binding protein